MIRVDMAEEASQWRLSCTGEAIYPYWEFGHNAVKSRHGVRLGIEMSGIAVMIATIVVGNGSGKRNKCSNVSKHMDDGDSEPLRNVNHQSLPRFIESVRNFFALTIDDMPEMASRGSEGASADVRLSVCGHGI